MAGAFIITQTVFDHAFGFSCRGLYLYIGLTLSYSGYNIPYSPGFVNQFLFGLFNKSAALFLTL